MSLYTASLNSGSNGNCYYVGNQTGAILVDAGLSCRETERRMARIGLSMKTVKAIFISHEHSDHIRGLENIAKKHHLPVYVTPKTLQRFRFSLDAGLVRPFYANQPVVIDGLTITGFPKFHDASDPHSFTIAGNHTRIGVLTDIGRVCPQVIAHFSQCHAVYLESNYDEMMLENGRYPYHLKQRIRSGHGHLSNTEALDLFKAHRPHFMSHVFLSHLSQDNNNPRLVLDLFTAHAGNTEVVVASRYAETAVYHIAGNSLTGTMPATQQPAPQQQAVQTTIF